MRLRQRAPVSWRQELATELALSESRPQSVSSALQQRVGAELTRDALLDLLDTEWLAYQRRRVPERLLLVVLGLVMTFTIVLWPVGVLLLYNARPSAQPPRRWRNAFLALTPFLSDPQSGLSIERRVRLWQQSRHANLPTLRLELMVVLVRQLQRLSAQEAVELSPHVRRFLCKGLTERPLDRNGAPTGFDVEFMLAALLTLADTLPHPEFDPSADTIRRLRLQYTDRRVYEALEVYLDSRSGGPPR